MNRVFYVCLCLFAVVLSTRATTVAPPEFTDLVNGSDYIVRARVSSTQVRTEVHKGKSKPYTYVTLEVLEVIAGSPPSPLILRMLGGQTTEGELVVHGAPVFTVGDEDVLFIRGNGRSFTPLYALMHGKYRVKEDAATGASYVARANGVPLTDLAEVSLPIVEGRASEIQQRRVALEDALTPREFSSLIRATRSAKGESSTTKRK